MSFPSSSAALSLFSLSISCCTRATNSASDPLSLESSLASMSVRMRGSTTKGGTSAEGRGEEGWRGKEEEFGKEEASSTEGKEEDGGCEEEKEGKSEWFESGNAR